MLLNIKEYFPAGGHTSEEIQMTDIRYTARGDVIFARAILPPLKLAKEMVIYYQTLPNGKDEYRTISAKCPHQGADISQDELQADGNVYCSLHHRPICIFSEYNYAYLVEKRADKFVIVKT